MLQEMRRAAVAGRFYTDDPVQLRSEIEAMLETVAKSPAPATAAVVPHAGLMYSGQCAAEVWGRVNIPDTVVIIAPNHAGRFGARGGAGVWVRGAFETPLGEVQVRESFAAALVESCDLVNHDAAAHQHEHAIEVELPFLRVLAPEASIVPIVLAWDEWELCGIVASDLADVISRWDGDVLLVASSDMTHYESAAAAKQKDDVALAAVERLDGRELLEICHRDNVTMCGRAPTAVVIEAARQLGATSGRLIDYRHSGWVTGNDSDVVAYAGVIIT